MRKLLTILLLSVSTISLAQSFGFNNVEPGDEVLLKAKVRYDTIRIPVEDVLKDKDGRTKTYAKDGLFYIRNYKPVPMGYYCDTTFKEVGPDLQYVGVEVLVDRRLVFHVEFPFYHRYWYHVFVDREFFLDRGKGLR